MPAKRACVDNLYCRTIPAPGRPGSLPAGKHCYVPVHDQQWEALRFVPRIGVAARMAQSGAVPEQYTKAGRYLWQLDADAAHTFNSVVHDAHECAMNSRQFIRHSQRFFSFCAVHGVLQFVTQFRPASFRWCRFAFARTVRRRTRALCTHTCARVPIPKNNHADHAKAGISGRLLPFNTMSMRVIGAHGGSLRGSVAAHRPHRSNRPHQPFRFPRRSCRYGVAWPGETP